MQHLVIASPHRYADLARLWHRWVMRDVAPAFRRAGLQADVTIFRDANPEQFTPELFPGVAFLDNGAGMRDHNDFYDAALDIDCDLLFFLDSDTFLFDADWACRHLEAFADPEVASVSLVSRKGRPAMFALLCRRAAYRELGPRPFRCRYEFPKDWPNGVSLENGDAATRELIKRGRKVLAVGLEESAQYTANFRSSTALRATREIIDAAAGDGAFDRCFRRHRAYTVPAHDNILLGCLYEALYGESFAPDREGKPLGGSATLEDLQRVVAAISDPDEIARLRERFRRSRQAILRMATREGVAIPIPAVFFDEEAEVREVASSSAD